VRKIKTLKEAVDYFREIFLSHPERNALMCSKLIAEGKRRKYPVIYLNHLANPNDDTVGVDEFVLPEVATPDTPEGLLAREIINLLDPLRMNNPVCPSLGLGKDTATLTTLFGFALDPAAGYAPSYVRTIEDILRDPEPDLVRAGLMPEMKKRIDLIKSALPDDFKIMLPDMQGPFNLYCSMVGTEGLIAPYVEEKKYRKIMMRIVRVWLGVRKLLLEWIGADRLNPTGSNRISECSVNMISADMYKEYVLEYDLIIAKEIGPIHLHHCSGPHVFHVVYENLPVCSVEAGYIEKTCAGSTSVEEVMKTIGERDIPVLIGEELPADFDKARDIVMKHLDLYERHTRIGFGYTGMYWLKKDRTKILELHRELDEYWERRFGDIGE
jgi:hypothetical protein